MRILPHLGLVWAVLCASTPLTWAQALLPERTDLPVLRRFDPQHERRAADARFHEMMCLARGLEEAQPDREQDPAHGPHREPEPMPDIPAAPVERKFEEPFLASDACGLVVLATGLAGWVALGIAVLILERKQAKPA